MEEVKKEMKKKLLISIMVIGIAATLLGAGTVSWFFDIDPVPGTITAGDITVEITNGNPISIEDIKPCFNKYAFITIENTGTNMGCLWIHYTNVIGLENGNNDPEQEAYWERSGLDPDRLRFDNDIERFITIDVFIDDGVLPLEKDPEDTIIINPLWVWKLADIECQWIPIAECLEPGTSIVLGLSYHLEGDAGNQYQTDQCIFDLDVMLQQTNAPDPEPAVDLTPQYEEICPWRVLRLENKANFGKPSLPNGNINENWWSPILNDDKYGILTYKRAANEFEYSFEGFELNPNTDYCLIYYADPWPGDGIAHDTGGLIATMTTDNLGMIDDSGSVELNTDMPNPGDWNHPDGAKIWLVLSDDYDGDKMTAWTPAEYLFEMRLIHYDDTEI